MVVMMDLHESLSSQDEKNRFPWSCVDESKTTSNEVRTGGAMTQVPSTQTEMILDIVEDNSYLF
jgi:hypothetical protein